jgi:hypothetical protein
MAWSGVRVPLRRMPPGVDLHERTDANMRSAECCEE